MSSKDNQSSKGIVQQIIENKVEEGNIFSMQAIKDVFNYMDEISIPETTNEDIQLTVTDNKGTKYWIDYNEWIFMKAWRNYRMGYRLTKEEKKILNLKDE